MVNFCVISKSQKCFTVYRDTVSVHVTDSVQSQSRELGEGNLRPRRPPREYLGEYTS